MRIAIVQTNPVFGKVEENVNSALALMEKVGADLFILPELFNTGYNFTGLEELTSLAEEVKGKTYSLIASFVKKKSCHVIYGFAEKADALYNSCVLLGPDGLVGLYRKVHLFYRENLFFARGNLGFPVFDLPSVKVGMMICFDWIYPESARTLALKGAQLIAHPSNLVMPHCPDSMLTRCLENRVFTATADRVGTEDRGGLSLSFIGKSEIISPRGKILVRMGMEETGVEIAEIDPAQATDKKVNEFNDLLKDRKPDLYF